MSEYEPGSCVVGAKPHQADGTYVADAVIGVLNGLQSPPSDGAK